jgi:hypothetical protein
VHQAGDPAYDLWLTEIFAARGMTCMDYNLRSGCGVDDEFVELYASGWVRVPGWAVDVGACTHMFFADSYADGFKVVFEDEFTNCPAGFPISGTVTLRNAFATPIATRTYETPITGRSWAAEAYTFPAGLWNDKDPSPGKP